ncbi:hypothetical protein J5TS1_27880 [Bacillus licheniformis]|nr:hypothetical protein BL1202_01095 [Bacillus licheniformis]AUZ30289.1 hypothetical protein C1T27_08015 [Bacillus licheniformis]AWV40366.1 hypothetical protein CD200_07970 [Bacillus licheniformis]AZN79840.1 hypothetical protein CXG95_12335 [Bacillus licheniformis]PSS53920.1 hypothetical protein C6399_00515 [Bacillus licheniformis]
MDFVRVEVLKRRMSVGRIIPRVLSGLIGLFLLLISIILFVTIIGILPGIGLGGIGLLFLVGAFTGSEQFECPRCGFKKNIILYGKHNASCRKCKQNIAIDWIKDK